MEIAIKENGKKIKQMAMEFIIMEMELNMKELGMMTNKMEKGLKFGQMALNIKVSLVKDLNVVMENLLGLMEIHTKANLKIILLKE